MYHNNIKLNNTNISYFLYLLLGILLSLVFLVVLTIYISSVEINKAMEVINALTIQNEMLVQVKKSIESINIEQQNQINVQTGTNDYRLYIALAQLSIAIILGISLIYFFETTGKGDGAGDIGSDIAKEIDKFSESVNPITRNLPPQDIEIVSVINNTQCSVHLNYNPTINKHSMLVKTVEESKECYTSLSDFISNIIQTKTNSGNINIVTTDSINGIIESSFNSASMNIVTADSISVIAEGIKYIN